MFDNPASGSNSMTDALAAMKAKREPAEQPDPVESEITGGTEEAALEPQSVAEEQAPPEQQATQDVQEQQQEQAEDEAPRYTVKINGEEKEVSLDDLQSGYMMHSDYTKKTMAHAEEVKSLAEKQAQFDNERAAKLQELESFIEQQDQSIDWENLRDTDPEEYIRQKELQDKRRTAAADERKDLEAKQQKQLEEYTNAEAAKLTELMGPTWTDEKRVKDFDQASSYLQSMGVGEEEISQLRDARFWMMAFDAMRYRQLEGTKDRVSKEVKQAPKSVKPGQTRVPESKTEVDKARTALQNSDKFTSDHAAVALLQAKRGKRK